MFTAALFVIRNPGNKPNDLQLRMYEPTVWSAISDVGGNVIWYNYFGRLSGSFYQSQTYRWAIALLGTHPVEMHNVCQKAVRECSQHSHTAWNNPVRKSQAPFWMFDWQVSSSITHFNLLPHTCTSQKEGPGAHPLAQAGSSNHTNSSTWEGGPYLALLHLPLTPVQPQGKPESCSHFWSSLSVSPALSRKSHSVRCLFKPSKKQEKQQQ